MDPVQLLTLDPGHFHAALVQKEMYPGVSPRVHVYAPLGPDLLAHLARIAAFNARPDRPTNWQLEVHAGSDFRERLLAERPGNVVVLSGRNRDKISHLAAAVDAGLHVLADKPWIIQADDLPCLESVLDDAAARGLVAYDIMTERYEITSVLQKALVAAPEVFGEPVPGTVAEPGVQMESKHFLLKQVAGVVNRRPPWFFDVEQQGEGLTDVGTHLVDLVNWVLFPTTALNYRRDIHLGAASRWPTLLSRDDFTRVTGSADFPPELDEVIADGRLSYFCNTAVSYTVRGIHVRLNVLWDYEAPPGTGDTHHAVFRGTRSRVEVHQGQAAGVVPGLFVVPAATVARKDVRAALARRVTWLREAYPGLALQDDGQRFQVEIPDELRTGHESHFAEVTRQFLRYLQDPASMPTWERAAMLAKYYVTTGGVERARATH